MQKISYIYLSESQHIFRYLNSSNFSLRDEHCSVS